MYLGIDIGGTKTLVATISDDGIIQEKVKFATPQKYDSFAGELNKAVSTLKTTTYKAAGIGIPGRLNHDRTETIRLANLDWQSHPIKADCEELLNCPVVIENDANLGALSEAMLHKNYLTVLYFTIGTGIGTGVVYNQQLDPALIDGEGGQVLLPYDGKLTRWERFASGKAIYEHFDKKVADIGAEDQDTWRHITHNWALGMWENLTIIQPDLIIIGGGVGVYFDRFETLLREELDAYKEVASYVRFPDILAAKRPEEAVIFGCYDLAKQKFGDGPAN